MAIIGADSPMARDRDRIVPVSIPGKASDTTIFRVTCHCEAPSAYAPSRYEWGTLLMASRDAIIITGKIRSVIVNAPANILRPNSRALTNNPRPNIP